MNGKFMVIILITVLIGALLSGCIGNPETEARSTPSSIITTSPVPPGGASVRTASGAKELEGTISLSGAWALYPMAVRWGEEFRKLHPKVRVEVSAGGAGKGMADAIGGLVDIGMVSRDIDPSEIEKGAYPIGVAKDAVVPTINVKNPAAQEILRTGIKRSAFVKIYINGSIKTWGEAIDKPEIKQDIHVYTRSDAAGAPEIWAKYLGKKQESLKGTGVYGDPGLLSAVQKDPLGLGYNNYNYALDMGTGQPIPGIQIIPFDVNENGVVDPDEDISTKEKTIAAIKKGVFPHPPARVEFFVTKGKPTGLTAEFIKWTLTDGQKFLDEVGYIELTKETLDGELRKLD